MRSRVIAVAMALALCAAALGQETYKEAWGKASKTYRARKYKEAVPEFEAAAKVATKPAEKWQARMYVCYSLYNSRQYDKCAEAARAFVETPGLSKSYLLSGRSYQGYSLYNTKKYAECIECWKKMMEIPGVSKAYQALSLYYIGLCENGLKQYDKAIETLEKCIAVSGGPTGYGFSAQIYLAQFYAYRKNDLEKGVKLMQAALDKPKLTGYERSRVEYETGRLYQSKGQSAKAREYYAKAVAAETKNDNYRAWAQYFTGLILVTEKKPDEARAAFESILKMKKAPANIIKYAKTQIQKLDQAKGKGR